MLNAVAVAAGGALGALARYWVSGVLYKSLGTAFPWGTLGVNVIGSFAIGAVFVFVEQRTLPDAWRLAIVVGLLGGFTTFSTFSIDTVTLIGDGAWLRALANVVASVVTCLLACAAGIALVRAW